MASRIIHYAIAKKLCSEINKNISSPMVLGAIASDMSSKMDGSYGAAHFKDRDAEKIGINWNIFLEKYGKFIYKDDFFLGYFTHLISDAVWLKFVQDKCVKILQEKKINFLEAKYRDFKTLNGILIRQCNLEKIVQYNYLIDMDEINKKYYDKVVNSFINDFDNDFYRKLDIFDESYINNYISYCVKVCKAELANYNNKMYSTLVKKFYTVEDRYHTL